MFLETTAAIDGRWDDFLTTATILGLDAAAAIAPGVPAIAGPARRIGGVARNRQIGAAFENSVISAFGASKNTTSITMEVTMRNGSTRNYTTIPDIWDSRNGIIEAKTVADIGSTPQLRAQMALSEETGSRFTLVLNSQIDPNNISQQLIDEVSDVKGNIILYNPDSGLMEQF